LVHRKGSQPFTICLARFRGLSVKFPKLGASRPSTKDTQTFGKRLEATYTRERAHHLRRANLGIEKLRFLLRLTADLKLLDRRRYEHAARTLDDTGRLVGGWMKAHTASSSEAAGGKNAAAP
jgi:hypothetical protein